MTIILWESIIIIRKDYEGASRLEVLLKRGDVVAESISRWKPIENYPGVEPESDWSKGFR